MPSKLYFLQVDGEHRIPDSPEIALVRAVIIRAIWDVCYVRKRESANVAREARAWLFSDDTREWSFLWDMEQITSDSKGWVKAVRARVLALEKASSPKKPLAHNAFVRPV